MAYANLAISLKTTRSTAVNTAIGSAATINIYTGTQPANPDTTASGSLLCTLTCTGAFGTVTSGVLTASAIPGNAASATGTAGWARVATSGGVGVLDMDVSATGGGGSMQLSTTSIVSGATVTITSATVSEA